MTNPGSDLPAALVEQYGIELTPQQIVVDGISHDTRPGIAREQIDAWVQSAKEHPYVLGTSAAEFAKMFTDLGRDDPELLAVMTSRKLIQSHDAAVSAVNTLARRSKRPLHIRVVDTGVTSVGAGLVTLLAAVARAQSMPLAGVHPIAERFSAGLDMRFCVGTMDYLVKGGRAGVVRAWMADLLGLRPVLALQRGEVVMAGKISIHTDVVTTLANAAVEQHAGRPVWVAVTHGAAPALAERLAAELRDRLAPAFVYVEPLSPSIYLHLGPGSLGYCVGPIDQLGWDPPPPNLGE